MLRTKIVVYCFVGEPSRTDNSETNQTRDDSLVKSIVYNMPT